MEYEVGLGGILFVLFIMLFIAYFALAFIAKVIWHIYLVFGSGKRSANEEEREKLVENRFSGLNPDDLSEAEKQSLIALAMKVLAIKYQDEEQEEKSWLEKENEFWDRRRNDVVELKILGVLDDHHYQG